MPRTQLTTREIGSVQRNDLDTTTAGQAVVTKIIQGTGVTISSTGTDAGTGDVTINATGGGGDTPGGSGSEVQYRAGASTLGGAANVNIASGDLNLDSYTGTTLPSAPGADSVTLFSRKRSGRNMLSMIGPTGLDVMLQPNLFSNRIAIWQANGGNQTTFTSWGFNTFTQIITATARTQTFTNALTASRRLGFVTAATASLNTGMFHPQATFFLSASPNTQIGGFFMVVRFGIPVIASTGRVYVGLSSLTAAPTAATQPSAQSASHIVLAADSTDTNLQIMTRNGTTNTKADTGIAKVNTGVLYDLILFAPPGNNTTVYWQLTSITISSASAVSGSVTATLPAANTLLTPHIIVNSGTTASAANIDIVSVYVETDNT